MKCGTVAFSLGLVSVFSAMCVVQAQVSELWVARYDGSVGGKARASALVVDSEGNVHVTGTSGGLGSTGAWINDYETVKYNSEGHVLWTAQYDGPAGRRDEAEQRR